MRILSWRQIVDQISTWWFGKTPRNPKRSDFTRLTLRRLEERRVLDGAPLVSGVTVEDMKGAIVVDVNQSTTPNATQNSHDITVALDTRHGQIELELTDHGTILYEAEFDKIKSVTFNSTGHDTALTVDFSHGDPLPQGGLIFSDTSPRASGAPGNSLHLVNGSANSVGYVFDGTSGGQVNIANGSQNSVICFSDTSLQVQDELTAATRSFAIGAGISQVQLSQADLAAGMSQLGLAAGTNVDFQDPSTSLSVNFERSAATGAYVSGLGAGFNANVSIVAGAPSAVELSGPINLGTGSLTISAGSIEVDGPVQSAGGTIELSATQSIVVAPGGELATQAAAINLSAPSITQQGAIVSTDGGSVRLDAGSTGTLVDSGTIDVSGLAAGQHGGMVDLLGKDVGITGQAVVNASGSSGGGVVRIGGDFRGSNPSIQNAAETFVGSDVVIDVDALDYGNGGQVVVWSDQATLFYGTIDARGGAVSGDGGNVEISSRQGLAEQGLVDTSAAHGRLGSLLLDPQFISIIHSAVATGPTTVAFSDPPAPPGTLTISDAALNAAAGNITLDATQGITTGAGVSIVLQTNVSITLDTRNASGDQSAPGAVGVSFASGTGITATGTGAITIFAGYDPASNTYQTSADATVGSLQTAGGNITVGASGNLTVAGQVQSKGGAIAFTADGAATGTGLLTVSSPVNSTVVNGGGNVSLTAADIKLTNQVAAGTGSVSIQTLANEAIALGNASAPGGLTLSTSELSDISSGALTIGDVHTTSITADGVIMGTSQGTVTLQALAPSNGMFTGGSLTFVNHNSISQSLIATAQNTITFGPSLTILAGTANKAGSLVFNAANGMFDTGDLTLIASNGVTLNGSLTTDTVPTPGEVGLTVDADSDNDGIGTFTVNNGAAVNTTNTALNITAADVVLDATGSGSLNSGNATTKIATAASESIGLGRAVGNLTLDDQELSHITAQSLMLGNVMATQITVDGVTQADSQNIGQVTLNAQANGGHISFTTNPSTFQALSASAFNGIDVQTNLTTLAGNLFLNGDADNAAAGVMPLDNIVLNSGVNLTSAAGITLQATTGAMSDVGNLTLNAATGVTINSNLTTGTAGSHSGALTINADTSQSGNTKAAVFTVENNATVRTNESALSITAATVQLTAGFLNSGTTAAGITTIATATDATIVLGNTGGGVLTLSQAMLNNITAGALTIGSNHTTSIVSANIKTTSQQGTVTLNALQSASNPGSIRFQGLQNDNQFYALVANAANGVTFNNSVTTTGGSMTINADANSDGTGTLTVASGFALTTNSHALTITAASIVLNSPPPSGITLNSGAGTTTIMTAKDESIGLGTIGAGHATGDLTLSETQLKQISSGALIIGGAHTTRITSDSVTTTSQQGTVTLLALQAANNSGSITFQGQTNKFAALNANAANGVTLNSGVTTTGIATINADANSDGVGTFTVNGGASVNTGNNALNITAANLALTVFPATPGTLNSGTATTTIQASDNESIGLGAGAGAPAYHNDIVLNNAVLANITSGSFVVGGATTGTITADGYTSTEQGPVTLLAQAVGASVNFIGATSSFLTLDATANKDIETSTMVTSPGGYVDLHSPVTLNGATSFNSTLNAPVGTGGNITFEKTIDSASASHNDLTLTTGPGTVTFTGAIGSSQPLGDLTVFGSGSTQINGGAVTTSGNQTYNDAVTINRDTTLTGGNVMFGQTLDAAAGAAASNLTVNTTGSGTTTFARAVGSNKALTSLTNDLPGSTGSTQINGSAVKTSGNQTYNAAVTINRDTTLTGGNVTFGQTLDAAAGAASSNLTVNTTGNGTTTFGGAVGSAGTGLTSLTNDLLGSAGNTQINGGAVTTSGNQTYNAAVTINRDTTLTGGNVTFRQMLDAAAGAASSNLTVNTTGSGTTTFDRAVGSAGTGLTSLTNDLVGSAGKTQINGGAVTTSGNQTYNDAVTINQNTALTGGNVTFGQTLDAAAGAASSNLTVNTSGSGTTTFAGAVGSAGTGLTSLTNDLPGSAGKTQINGGAVTTSGNQTYNAAVTINRDTTLTGENVTFGQTLDAAAGTASSNLIVNTSGSGTTTFAGAVGSAGTGLTSLTNDLPGSAGKTQINGGAVTTSGNQTYNAAVTINRDTTLTGGNVTFGKTVDSATTTAEGLTITAGAGDVAFKGAVGFADPLGALSIASSHNFLESAGIRAQSLSVTSSNNVTFTGKVTTTSAVVGGGPVTVVADSNGVGAGLFTETGGVDASGTNSALSITADQVNLTGTLNSGTAATTIQGSQNQTIGLGTGTGHIQLTNAELDLIHSRNLVIGGSDFATSKTGSINVAGITAAESQQFGAITLTAGAASADITFSGASTFFNALGANHAAITAVAANDININAAISTTAGDVFLDAKQNLTIGNSVGNTGSITTGGAVPPNGTLTIHGGIFVPANSIALGAGNVTLIAEGAQLDAIIAVNESSASSIIVTAPRDIIVEATIQTTTPGADITLTADDNHTGVGGVWITAIGNLISDGSIFISGSNLFNRSLPGNITPDLPTGIPNNPLLSIEVAKNSSVATNPVVAAGNITIENSSSAPDGAIIDLNGIVQSTGAGTITVNAVTPTDASNVIQTNSTIESAGGAIDFNSPVILTGATIVDSTVNAPVGSAGDVTFSFTINGPYALIANSAGVTTFSKAVGATTALTSLTTDAAGTTAINGGAVYADNQDYQDAVTLGQDTTLAKTSALDSATQVAFEKAVDGTHALTVDAVTTTFGGIVGGTHALSSLTTNAAGTTAINGGAVYADNQDYQDAVTLGQDTTLAKTSALDSATQVAFEKTVDGTHALTVDAVTTTFGGIVGGTHALSSLTTDAAGTTAINGGAVYADNQDYQDAVTLGQDTTLAKTSALDSATQVAFEKTVDGTHALTVDAVTTTFGGIVGGTHALSSLTTNAAGTTAINGGAVYADNQDYQDAVTLGQDTTLAKTSALDSATQVAFEKTVDGTHALTVDAVTTTFGGIVGGTHALSSLTTNAAGTTAINGGAVYADNQDYRDAVTLGQDTTLAKTSALDSATQVAFEKTVDGTHALTVDAVTTTFGGIVGGTHALSSLTTNAAGTTAINGGAVYADNQDYQDAVTLGQDTTLAKTSALDSATQVAFEKTVDGTHALTVDAVTTTFGGIVGGTHALSSLTTDAAGTTAINGGAVYADNQDYQDAVTLGQDTTLAKTSALDSATQVAFEKTVDGTHALTVDAVTTTFGGIVGGTHALSSLTTNAAGTTAINGGAVYADNQDYQDAVTLGQDTTLAKTSALDSATQVAFEKTVDGTHALTVDAVTTTFGGIVGGTHALSSLTTNAAGTTAINGGAVYADNQDYRDAVTLGQDTTLAKTSALDSATQVAFEKTVDGTHALTVDAVTTTFGGIVGGTHALSSLTTNAAGTTAINGGAVYADNQDYQDAVTLGQDTTLAKTSALDSATQVAFEKTVDGTHALTVDAVTTTFGGIVGGTHALSSLTTDAAGTTAINGGAVYADNQDYQDAVTLGQDTTLAKTSALDSATQVAFEKTVDGTHALTVDAVTTTFGGIVGGTHALSSLTTNAAGTTAINGGAVTTTADQTFNDTVTINQDTTLNGVNVTFAQTLDADAVAASSNLTVNASGDVTLMGAIGFSHPLGALSVVNSQNFVESAGIHARSTNVNATNDVTYGGSVISTLAGAGAMTAFAGHDINVNAALQTSAGDVDLEAQNQVTMNTGGSITTTPGSGGKLTITGAVFAHDITVGAGNVTLVGHGSGIDLIISGSIIGGVPIVLESPRDIIVEATIQTTTATDITLIADENNTGTGGVWITAIGNLIAGRDVFISGSNLFNRSLPGGFTPDLPPAAPLSIEVANNASVNPIAAVGNITIENSSAAPNGAIIDLNGVVQSTGAGNISLTAATLAQASQYVVQTNSTIESAGGEITVDSPIILTGTTTVDSTENGAAPGGDITFTSSATIDSQGAEHNSLTLDAGTGSVFFNANIGAATGSSALGALTVADAAGGVTFGQADTASLVPGGQGPVTQVNTTGAVSIGSTDVIGGTGIVFNGGANTLSVTTTGAAVTLDGAVTLQSSLSINTDPSDLDNRGGDITFTSSATIDSQANESNSLTLDAGTGSVFFNANIGAATGSSALGALTVADAAAGVTFGQADTASLVPGGQGPVTQVNTTGAVSIGSTDVIGGTGIVFNGGANTLSVTTTGAAVTLDGAVTLQSSLSINTDPSDLDNRGGDITFTSSATIDSQANESNSLTLDAGTGSVFFNANIGAATGSSALGALTVADAAAGVTFGQADTASLVPGGQGPVTQVNTTGAISIGSTDVIGGTGITFNGGANTLAVTTTGAAVTLDGAVTLQSGLSINTDPDDLDNRGGDITFTSSATIDSQANESNSLTLDAGTGHVFFNANIGAATGSSALGALTVADAAGGVTFGQADTASLVPGGQGPVTQVNTTGAVSIGSTDVIGGTGIVFNGGANTLSVTTTGAAVTLDGAVTLQSSLSINTDPNDLDNRGGDITFTSSATIDSQANESNSLTLDAGTGSVFFNANIGAATGSSALGALTVADAAAGVTFGQADTASLVPGGQGPVTQVNTTGAVSIGSTDIISGTGITFNGGANTLAVTTTGAAVTLDGAVTLQSGLSINTDPKDLDNRGGDITFTSSATIDSQANESNSLTLDAGTGSVFFNANIGAATGSSALGALTVADAAAGVTFGQADTASLVPGGQGPVTQVNTTGAISIGSTDVIGGTGIVFNGGANTLSVTTTGAAVTLDGAVTLQSGLSINTDPDDLDNRGGDITFTSSATIDSQANESNSLTLDAGTGHVFFNANIGAATGSSALGALTVADAAGGVTFGQADTASLVPGGQGPVTQVNTTGAVSIGSTDVIGGTGIVFNGGANTLSVTTTGAAVTLDGAVTLQSSLSINTDPSDLDNRGGDITFTSSATIDSQANESNSLTLDAGTGSVFFNANIGAATGSSALGALTVADAAAGVTFGQADTASLVPGGQGPVTQVNTTGAVSIGSTDVIGGTGIVFNGGANTLSVTTTGAAVTLDGAVTLKSGLSVNTDPSDLDNRGGDITFTSSATIDSQANESNSLTLDAGTAHVFFNANIGAATGTSALGALTVADAAGGVTFGQADTASLVPGGQGPVTQVNTTGAVSIGSTDVIGGTGIVFNGGANTLAVTTTGAAVTLDGAVTLQSSLSVNTVGGAVAGGDITFTNSGTIDSQGAEHNNLRLTAGTGAVFFNANIGAATATSSLDLFTITTAAGGVTFGQSDANSGSGGTGPVTEVNTVGPIDISTADGAMTGSILVNNAVMTTADHNVTLTTTNANPTVIGGDIGFSSHGQIQSSGGVVTLAAQGQIVMADGAIIDSQTGTISLEAIQDIALARLVTTNTGPVPVQVTSTAGQISNSGNTAGPNISAAAIPLRAATGIGSTLALETQTTTLAMVNSTSGNIQITNVGGPLFISTVGTFTGIQNNGSGFTSVTNAGALTVQSDIIAAQGTVSLMTTAGDITSNAQIYVNGGSGGISFMTANNLRINDSNGNGQVPDLEVKGTGAITGTAQNAVTFANNVLIQTEGGGGIGFRAVNGDLTTNARIYSEGGNGSIVLLAGNNLVLHDSGFAPDIMTTSGSTTSGNATNPGTGQILGTAGNSVLYGANVSLQTDQGWQHEISNITTLYPNVFNVAAPLIKVDGSAMVTGSFGDPGAHDYKLLVDWHDGTIDSYIFSDPGTFTFFHQYKHFPNTEIEAAPIPISVTVINDPNIQLIGKQQVPITNIINNNGVIPGELDVQALGNGFFGTHADPNPALEALVALQDHLIGIFNLDFIFASSTEFTGPQTSNFLTFAAVPGNGIGLISIDSNIQISTVHQSVAPIASTLPTGPPPQGSQLQAEVIGVQSENDTTVEERIVIIELLDENGQPLSSVQVKESVLGNLDDLFETLNNGRYRISVIEPGETTQRTLLDVNLRGNKMAPDVEEGEKPPTIDDVEVDVDADDSKAALPANEDGDISQVQQHNVLEPTWSLVITEEIPVGLPIVAAPSLDRESPAANPELDGNVEDSARRSHTDITLGGAALGLGALAACVGADTWKDRVDATLAAADAGALSKSARLARRLRQRDQQTPISHRRKRRV